ncbi:MAG: ExbD/TolR family protein [Bdellovibrionales bacterium]
MAAKSSDSDEVIADINVVPLVDIILVVLIIFMVTSPAMMKPNLVVDLPAAGSAEDGEPSSLQIAVTADGRLHLNNAEVDEVNLRAQAAIEVGKNPEVQAIVAADQSADYGQIIRVLDWVKSSGVKHLAVTTDRPLEE